MFVSVSQFSHFTRTRILNDAAVPACFVVGFILMISSLGLWLIHFIKPQHAKLIPTLLEFGSFLALGLGAHLMDRSEHREFSERIGEIPAKLSDRTRDQN